MAVRKVLPGRATNTDGEFYFSAIYTDVDFLNTFQLEMKDGRFFSNDFPGDTTALVINEKATEILGFKDPIGKVLTSGDTKYRIIGVIKNFHFKTLKIEIDPLVNSEITSILQWQLLYQDEKRKYFFHS